MSYEDIEQEFINSLIQQINKWSLMKGLSLEDHAELLEHIVEDLNGEMPDTGKGVM